MFHLYTTEVVERVSVVEDNVNVTSPINIGSRNSTSLELNAKYNYFVRNRQFQNQHFDFSGKKWTGKLTTKLKLPADIDLEFTGNYESGFKTVQGDVSGFAYMDTGIRKNYGRAKL